MRLVVRAFALQNQMTQDGLEPSTSPIFRVRSNQLSYRVVRTLLTSDALIAERALVGA
jgi:hypothetical protein